MVVKWSNRVSVRICIWLRIGYVIKFLMLICEMIFVFHKSKQSLTRVTLKKLSKTINCTKVCFCLNEWFCGEVVTGQIWFRSDESSPTIQAWRNFLSWCKCQSVVEASCCNPDILGSDRTIGHYSILSILFFSFNNPSLPSLVYSFTKLISYF